MQPGRKFGPALWMMEADLYGALGVPRSATVEDIRKQWKAVALRLHPDRTGDTSNAWHDANAAYDILSDPTKRSVYDVLGMDGVRLYEGALRLARASGTAVFDQPDNMPTAIHVLAVALGGAAVIVLACTFLLLAALRLDGILVAAWPLIFLPCWLATVLSLLVGAMARGGRPRGLWAAVLRLGPTGTTYMLAIAFELALCLKLELGSRAPISWLGAFMPLLVERGTALASLPAAHRARRRAAALRGKRAQSLLDSPPIASARQLLLSLALATQLSLLPAKLEGALKARWALVLAPLQAWALLDAASIGCIAAMECWARGVNVRGDAGDDATPHEQLRALCRHSARLGRLLALGAVAVLVGWSASALESAELGVAPLVRLLAPAFVGVGACFVCVAFAVVSVRGHRGPAEAARRPETGAPDEGEGASAAPSAAAGDGRYTPESGGGDALLALGAAAAGARGVGEAGSAQMSDWRDPMEADGAYAAEDVVDVDEYDYEIPPGPLPGEMPEGYDSRDVSLSVSVASDSEFDWTR